MDFAQSDPAGLPPALLQLREEVMALAEPKSPRTKARLDALFAQCHREISTSTSSTAATASSVAVNPVGTSPYSGRLLPPLGMFRSGSGPSLGPLRVLQGGVIATLEDSVLKLEVSPSRWGPISASTACYIVTGSASGAVDVTLMEWTSGRPLCSHVERHIDHRGAVNSVACHPTVPFFVASGGGDGTARVWFASSYASRAQPLLRESSSGMYSPAGSAGQAQLTNATRATTATTESGNDNSSSLEEDVPAREMGMEGTGDPAMQSMLLDDDTSGGSSANLADVEELDGPEVELLDSTSPPLPRVSNAPTEQEAADDNRVGRAERTTEAPVVLSGESRRAVPSRSSATSTTVTPSNSKDFTQRGGCQASIVLSISGDPVTVVRWIGTAASSTEDPSLLCGMRSGRLFVIGSVPLPGRSGCVASEVHSKTTEISRTGVAAESGCVTSLATGGPCASPASHRSLCAASTAIGTAYLLDLRTSTAPSALLWHARSKKSCNCVQFYPNASALQLLTGGDNCQVKLWDARQLKDPLAIFVCSSPVTSMVVTQDGAWIAAAQEEDCISLFSTREGGANDPVNVKRMHGGKKITSLALSSYNSELRVVSSCITGAVAECVFAV